MPTLILNLHPWAPSSHRPPPAMSQDPLHGVTPSHLLRTLEERSLGM